MEVISYDYFSKIDLRVAKVLSCQRIEGSEKLLKMEIEVGEQKRTIVAGIGKNYDPQDLVNKLIVIVANLEPRPLMGVISQGMLLAASDDSGKVILIRPHKKIKSGAKIK